MGNNDGFVDTEEFVKGIRKVPGVMDIKFATGEHEDDHHLQCLAKKLDAGGKISIIEFLGAFCFEDNHGVTDALAEHMVTVLFQHRHVIQAACRYFDTEYSGSVHKDEFLLVLQALTAEIAATGLHFSQSQIEDLCESLSAPDKANVISVPYTDFFEAFE